MLTKDFFIQIKKHLKTNGALLINFIGSPSFKNLYSKHFNQTVNSTFNCLIEPLNPKRVITNIIYACLSRNDDIIYTDNKINLFELVLKEDTIK